MFKKLVIIEKINMLDEDLKRLDNLAKEVIYYKDIPSNNEEIIKRIADADCALLSYTSKIDREVIGKAPNLKYIGMCCSLYSPESANVDILAANAKGISVRGIRDYGDEGVVEFIIYELVKFLEDYDNKHLWSDFPQEISTLKCSVIGLGTSGTLIAKALKFFGADVSYYSRTRKPNVEEKLGIVYKSLNECVKESDAIFLALNKNVLLLDEEQFNLMNGKKILFNTSIGPGFNTKALAKWLTDKKHFFFGDTLHTIGDENLWKLDNTFTINRSSGGKSYSAYKRLGDKVIKNIEDFLNGK